MKKLYALSSLYTIVAIIVAAYTLVVHDSRYVARSAGDEVQKFIDAQSAIGTTENPRERFEYETRMVADPRTGAVPADIKKRERRFVRSIPSREIVNQTHRARSTARYEATDWTRRGPRNVGGRTRALAIDIRNENIILAGGVSGGMWRSTNGGLSWNKVTQPGSHHSVTCLVQDTRPGKEDVWYYGTGELQGNSARGGDAPYRGDGIFKSTDNGLSWSKLESTAMGDEHTFNSQFQYVWNLAVNTSNLEEDEIYAACFGGIVRSMDGGESWSVVLGEPLLDTSEDLNDATASDYTDIEIAGNDIIYATLSSEGDSDDGGVYLSADGETWENITPDNWPSIYHRTVIGAAPSEPEVVYFMGDSNPYALWRFRYNGSAATSEWDNLSGNVPKFGGSVGDYNSQQSYNMVLKVHPEHSEAVFLGGTNLYRSTDGFSSSGSTAWIGGYDTANDRSVYANHYVDQHALVFYHSDPDKMLSGNDGGVFITENNLAENVDWQSLNNGYITTQFYSVAVDKSRVNDILLGGMQDNGSYLSASADFNDEWSRIIGGDGGYCAVAENGYYFYFSFQKGEAYRVTLNADHNLTSFARVDPRGAGQIVNQELLFVNPFVLDPNNNNRMYFAGGDRIWRNSNLSQIPSGSQKATSVNWTALDGTEIPSGSISALDASTNPGNIVYYGTTTGKLFRLDNAADDAYGAAVDITAAMFPENGYISNIAVDPSNANRLLVVFSNYNVLSVFLSEDGGQSFTTAAGNLEENADGSGSGPSVRWAQIIPLEGGEYIYLVGTSSGVYSTTQLEGSSTFWAREGESLIGNVAVPMIAYRSLDGLTAVATHGNGVYTKKYSNVKQIQKDVPPSGFELAAAYPNPFSTSTSIRYSIPQSGPVRIRIYNAGGLLINEVLHSYQFAGANEAVWYGVNGENAPVSNGLYIVRVEFGDEVKTEKLLYLK